ncbi:MAG: DUF485 domain-containing protein [Campylobacteraceae bacterium]|nr:DUF485 domain-containing protein [Campylobacteraceae bacterium]
MNSSVYERVKHNPKFTKLVTKRSKLAWTLSVLVLGVYYSFITIIAFFPEIFGIRLGDSVVTVGIPVGLGIILFTFFVTGIYIYKANKEFDTLTAQIKNEARDES